MIQWTLDSCAKLPSSNLATLRDEWDSEGGLAKLLSTATLVLISVLQHSGATKMPSERGHLPPIREAPEEVPKLDRDQIIVRPYVCGLVKSFERKAA